MVAGIFVMGNWKSLEELEDSITMKELQLLMDARNKETDRNQRFQAALKGIELPEEQTEEDASWEKAQAEAQAILTGKSEEQNFFEDFIDFETM